MVAAVENCFSVSCFLCFSVGAQIRCVNFAHIGSYWGPWGSRFVGSGLLARGSSYCVRAIEALKQTQAAGSVGLLRNGVGIQKCKKTQKANAHTRVFCPFLQQATS